LILAQLCAMIGSRLGMPAAASEGSGATVVTSGCEMVATAQGPVALILAQLCAMIGSRLGMPAAASEGSGATVVTSG